MTEEAFAPGARRPSARTLLVAAEVAAAAALVAAQLWLPWFRGSERVSWGSWHDSFVDRAVLLTFIAPYFTVAAVLARVIFRRGWAKIVVIVGFVAALLGSLETFGDANVIAIPGPPPTPDSGLWLFAVAAVAGVAIGALELVVRWESARD
jgi:hypothetical protein